MPKPGEQFKRSAVIERQLINEEARTVELAFSSEEPYERSFGTEILSHRAESMELSRLSSRGPVLLDHDMTKLIGVIEEVRIDESDRRGRALIRFGKSELAESIFQDVKDGIRNHVSVGYTIDETEPLGGKQRGLRVTKWTPYEVSLVSVPADPTVGVGRSIETDPEETPEELPETPDGQDAPETSETLPEQENETMPKEIEQARQAERQRINAITLTARKFGFEKMGEEAIENGQSADDFRRDVMDKFQIKAAPAADNTPVDELDQLGLNDKEKREYSISKAVRAAAARDWGNAGLEREVSDALAKETNAEVRGFLIPTSAMVSRGFLTGEGIGTTAGNPNANAAALVGTDHRADLFIDVLRHRTLAGSLGIQFHGGLRGNVSIPKMLTDPTVAWIDENEDSPLSATNFGTVPLSPKTISGSTKLTRRTLMQTAPTADAIIQNALIKNIGIGIDRAIFGAKGSTKAPSGLLDLVTNNDTAIAFKDLVWRDLVDMEAALKEAAVYGGQISYVGSAGIEAILKTEPKDVGSGGMVLENGVINGIPFHQTNLLTKSDTTGAAGEMPLWLGAFNAIHLGMWGTLDIVVDTSTEIASGGVVIRAFQDLDFNIEHEACFQRLSDTTAT